MEQQTVNAYKAVLPSGKVVMFRQMKVKYENMAIEAAGPRAGKNEALLQKLMIDELLKVLIMEIDGHKPDRSKLEAIDEMFEYHDIVFMRQVIAKIAGVEGEQKAPSLELVKVSGA